MESTLKLVSINDLKPGQLFAFSKRKNAIAYIFSKIMALPEKYEGDKKVLLLCQSFKRGCCQFEVLKDAKVFVADFISIAPSVIVVADIDLPF